jgi:hypothetical protein
METLCNVCGKSLKALCTPSREGGFESAIQRGGMISIYTQTRTIYGVGVITPTTVS